MSLRSAADKAFLNSLESWLNRHGEVLILIRYSHAAGNKDFEFHTSFSSLLERLHQLPPETCVTAFRTPQLQLRGIVDDEFIRKCLSSVPNGSEYKQLGLSTVSPLTFMSKPGFDLLHTRISLFKNAATICPTQF